MVALHTTVLHAVHREMGAKLVDFAGWEMPLAYGSQIDEHHRVRREAGMFDVSHMLVVDIEGEGARRLLRTLLANDVDKLSVSGKALYSCMLNEAGGVLDDLIVYRFAENQYRMVVNAGTADKDVDWMRAQCARLGADARITPRRDLAIIAIQGPHARERVWRARPHWCAASQVLAVFQGVLIGQTMIARTGYTGEDGYEIVLPLEQAPDLWQALAREGVAPCGLGARDTLRLEAGMNLYGQDMDESVTPLECGLAWTVSMSPARDFIGKGALARTPVMKQVGLVLIDKGVLRAHQSIRCSGEGEITSGGFAPTLKSSIALARLPAEAPVHAGDKAQAQVRGKWLRAKIVKPPFVRNGKILI
jgi:aminomethyltransferase